MSRNLSYVMKGDLWVKDGSQGMRLISLSSRIIHSPPPPLRGETEVGGEEDSNDNFWSVIPLFLNIFWGIYLWLKGELRADGLRKTRLQWQYDPFSLDY